MLIRRVLPALLAGTVGLCAVAPARADEGMWTFDHVPKTEIRRDLGVALDDAWLKKVQLASVRFNNGGSGSFVSRDGLVLTNHHVASDLLQELSGPDRDLFRTGFLARTREEELPAKGLELNVLVQIEDVTDRVNAAVKPDMDPAAANAARRAAIAEIEKSALVATGLRSDVVTLYQGGLYHLYSYRKYTDVRLVFAPEFDIAFFGGDPDNFTFPRFDLDITLFRVYEHGKPVAPEHWFGWSKSGSTEGEPAFVAGHPASTQRLNTLAHLEFIRDDELPFSIRMLDREVGVLTRYGALGEEQERQAHDDLFGVMNGLKAYRGRLDGLRNARLMQRKRVFETRIRKRVAADRTLRASAAGAWTEVADSRRRLRSFNARRRMLEGGAAFNSDLFWFARTLVRLPVENAKPNALRLKEFTDAYRESFELKLLSRKTVYAPLEIAKLTDSLTFMRDTLGASDPTVKLVLAGMSPEARARELVEHSRMGDTAYRTELAKDGGAAVATATDPMMQLVRSIDAESRALRLRFEDEVIGAERAAYARIARAIFEIEGTGVYPDATFTLRLSYGVVKGYAETGVRVAPYTTLGGVFERASRSGNRPPYRLPERWLQARDRIDPSIPFNFVSTHDIVGGNSGSPVLNRNAEIIGVVFDGNIQSLAGSFIYDESQNRAVSVDSRAILEALSKVYEARELVDELRR